MFGQYGFENVTIDQVMSAAGLTRGGFYAHFKNKEDLFVACVENGMSLLSSPVLAKLRKRVGPSLPIIGVGGVEDAETALEKIRAGADLVQLYSCMIYGGPGLPRRILEGLSAFLDREGIDHPGALRDTGLEQWASTPL